jgi:hypothetical protein
LQDNTASSGTANDLPYRTVGMAALAGMFSQKATNKLGELFDVLFQSKSEPEMKDPLNATSPVLVALVPDRIPAEGTVVRVLGLHFKPTTQVLADGRQLTSTYVSEGELSVQIKPSDFPARSSIAIRVRTPDLIDDKSAGKSLTFDGTQGPPDPAAGGDK